MPGNLRSSSRVGSGIKGLEQRHDEPDRCSSENYRLYKIPAVTKDNEETGKLESYSLIVGVRVDFTPVKKKKKRFFFHSLYYNNLYCNHNRPYLMFKTP